MFFRYHLYMGSTMIILFPMLATEKNMGLGNHYQHLVISNWKNNSMMSVNKLASLLEH